MPSIWTTRTPAQNLIWNGVAYGSSVFCAVAADGTNGVMTSSDGLSWTTQTPAVDAEWHGIGTSGALFVAGGRAGAYGVEPPFMTSSDGASWNTRTTGLTISGIHFHKISDIAWNGTEFCAVGWSYVNDGSPGYENNCITSTDGSTWTSRTINNIGANDDRARVAWFPGASLFIFVTNQGGTTIQTSPTGTSWTNRTCQSLGSAGQMTDVAANGSIAVIVGEFGAQSSTDGVNWTSRTAAAANQWHSVEWNATRGEFVAVATSGTGNRIMSSPDGINWTSEDSPSDSNWRGIASNGARWVGVGSSAAMTGDPGIYIPSTKALVTTGFAPTVTAAPRTAITLLNRTDNNSAGVTSVTSASFTPAANDLIVVSVTVPTSTLASPSLTSSQGTTFALVDTLNVNNAAPGRNYIYIANALSSAVAQTITFDCTGDASDGIALQVFGVSGMSRTGASAKRQSAQDPYTFGSTTATVVLPSAALAVNSLLGIQVIVSPSAMSPPSGWKELSDQALTPGTTHRIQSVARDSGFTTTTVTWGTAESEVQAVVIELDSSVPVVATPTTLALTINEQVPAIVHGYNFKPTTASLVAAGQTPTIRLDKFAVPSPLALVTAGLAPTVTGGQTAFGTANFTLADATTAATGSPAVDGDGTSTLADVATDGDGAPVVSGTANFTLENATVEAYGGNGANITLEDAGCVAAGTPVASGTGATTTDTMAAAAGAPVLTGSGVPTLGDAGGAASGSGIIDGTIAAPLDNVTVAAAGTLVGSGTGSSTVNATAAAAGQPVVTAAASIALANATSVGVGYPVYDLHLVSAALASPISLVLTYDSEPQLSIQSAEPSDWHIVSATGAAIEVSDVEVVGLTVVLTTSEHTDGASYTLIGSRNVYSVSGHRVLGPFNADYTGDGVVPTVTRVQCLDANTLRVFFSENMNDADLLDTSRYTIAGVSGDPLYVVPVALSVTKLTDNNVDITTTELVRGESYDLTVTVRDRGLNAVA